MSINLINNSNITGTLTVSDVLDINGTSTSTFAGQIDVDGAVSSFGPAGTGTDDAVVSIDGGSGTGGEAYLRLTRGGTSGFILNHAESSLQVRATANIPMYFYTNDTLALTLNTSQNATFAGNVTLNSRLTFEYNGSGTGNNYIETGTNTISFKSSAGTTIISTNFSTAATTFAGDVTVGHDLKMPTDGEIDWNAGAVKLVGTADNIKLQGGSLSITEDGSNAATLTESGSGDFTIASVDDLRLDSGGNDIVLRGASSSEFGRLTNDSQDFVIKNITSNKDIIFKGNDGGSTITALTLDMSNAGKATFAGTVDVDGGDVNIQAGALSITSDGSNKATFTETGAGLLTIAAQDDIVLDAASDITLDAGGNDIRLFNAGTEYGHFKQYNQGVGLYVSIQDMDFVVRGNDGGTTFSAFGLDMSEGGNATFAGVVEGPNGAKSAPTYSFTNDQNTGMYSDSADLIKFSAGGDDILYVGSSITAKTDIVLDSTNIELDTSLTTSQTSGTIIKQGGHMSALTAGKVYYGYASMTAMYWAQASQSSATSAKSFLAMSIGTDADVDGMLLSGVFYSSSHGFTIGTALYLSTSGNLTNTVPSTSNYYARVCGYALDANHIYFNPDNTWVKID